MPDRRRESADGPTMTLLGTNDERQQPGGCLLEHGAVDQATRQPSSTALSRRKRKRREKKSKNSQASWTVHTCPGLLV